jgi:hypothetical protein
MLTLPQVAAKTGIRLDLLRQRVKAVLAPEGLVVKIGGSWVTTTADVERIAERVRRK